MIAEDSSARSKLHHTDARALRTAGDVPSQWARAPRVWANLRSISVWPVVVFYRAGGAFVIAARVIARRRAFATIDVE